MRYRNQAAGGHGPGRWRSSTMRSGVACASRHVSRLRRRSDRRQPVSTGVGGGLVLRCYEPAGARGRLAPVLPDGWRLAEELDLLEQSTGPVSFDFLPFKVRSWRLEKA